MAQHDETLDPQFVEQQRTRLERLRDDLLRAERSTVAEERSLETERGDRPRDREEDATNLALRELDRSVHDRAGERLANVERALQKIREGTYGRSDASDLPISRRRLETVPEAIYTTEEQAKIEKGWVPPPRADREPIVPAAGPGSTRIREPPGGSR